MVNLRILSVVTTGLSVALIVILLTRGCDKPTEKPQDETLWRDVVEKREAVIREKDSIIATIVKERQLDSLKHDRAVTSLKQREFTLIRKLKAANADIQVISDSLPRVKRYVDLADSTIAIKDSLYTQAVNHSIALDSLYRIEVAALGQKNVAQQAVNEEYKARVVSLENKLSRSEKRLDRKKKFNRVLLGVSGGLAAAIAVMTLTN